MSMTTLWIVWTLIGVIGGYMGSKLLLDGEKLLVGLLCGIAGALLGGWAYMAVFGLTEQNGYISLITSMIVCAVGTWIYVSICQRIAARRLRGGGDDDNSDA